MSISHETSSTSHRSFGLVALVCLTLALPAFAQKTRAVSPGHKAPATKTAPTMRAVTITSMESVGGMTTIRLDDGSTITAPDNAVHIRSKQHGQRNAQISSASIKSGQAAIIRVRKMGKEDSQSRIKIKLFDSMQEAQSHMGARPK